MPGVLDILTHENVGDRGQDRRSRPAAARPRPRMESDRVWHDGQIIGVVVADTFEAAREAAFKVARALRGGAARRHLRQPRRRPRKTASQRRARGLPRRRRRRAPSPRRRSRSTPNTARPTQHHNPIELFTTTCVWNGEQLTIWEPSQFVYGLRGDRRQAARHRAGQRPRGLEIRRRRLRLEGRRHLAHRLDRHRRAAAAAGRSSWSPPATRASPSPPTAPRPGTTSSSAPTPDGKLRRVPPRGLGGHLAAEQLQRVRHRDDGADVRLPEHPDPGEHRPRRPQHARLHARAAGHALHVPAGMRDGRAGRTSSASTRSSCAGATSRQRDPVTGQPFSSRQLMTCFDQGAERFGWSQRNPQPGSHAATATGWSARAAPAPPTRPTSRPAAARVTLRPNGHARVRIAGARHRHRRLHRGGHHRRRPARPAGRAGHGRDGRHRPAAGAAGRRVEPHRHHRPRRRQGLRRAARAASRRRPPPATTARSPAATRPTLRVRGRQARRARTARREPLADAVAPRQRRRARGLCRERARRARRDGAMDKLYQRQEPDPARPQAQGRRPPTPSARSSSRCACTGAPARSACRAWSAPSPPGTIVNPLTAHSQYMGGMIWGLGAALLEATEIDPHAARYVNDNLSEYHIPVNADVRQGRGDHGAGGGRRR